MDLKALLDSLANAQVTVVVIGGGEYAGTLSAIGTDYIDLDQGPDTARALIPFDAIACVLHR